MSNTDVDRRIGRYRLTKLIGSGNMGDVFAGEDERFDRRVAIKLLKPHLEDESDLRARFYREAQAAARIGHRNAITVFDFGEHNGHPFIVMEMLDGATLDKYLRSAPSLDLERKVDLMTQVCAGMAAAHAAHIIHRDLKPGNLFVQSDGLLKVLDFGVARLNTSASVSTTTGGMHPGTLQFMSPEQARGDDIDPASDIFSAGAVFYCILTNRKPFVGDDWMRVLRSVTTEAPIPITDDEAPPALGAIVMKCLEKDVRQRYRTFQSVERDLSAFLRSYRAETLRDVGEAVRLYQAIVTRLDTARRAAAPVGEVVAGSRTVEGLKRQYPAVVARGADALPLIPFTRRQVAALRLRLSQELTALEQLERKFQQAERLIRAGDEAYEEYRYDVARTAYQSAHDLLPTCAMAEQKLKQCRAVLASRDVTAQNTRALLQEARQASQRSDWPRVEQTCRQILAHNQHVPLAEALLQKAREALAAAATSPASDVPSGPLIRAHATTRVDTSATLSGDEHKRLAHELFDARSYDRALLSARKAVELDPTDEEAIILLSSAIDADEGVRLEVERRRTAEERRVIAHSVTTAAAALQRLGELRRAQTAVTHALRLCPGLAESVSLLEQIETALGRARRAVESPRHDPMVQSNGGAIERV